MENGGGIGNAFSFDNANFDTRAEYPPSAFDPIEATATATVISAYERFAASIQEHRSRAEKARAFDTVARITAAMLAGIASAGALLAAGPPWSA